MNVVFMNIPEANPNNSTARTSQFFCTHRMSLRIGSGCVFTEVAATSTRMPTSNSEVAKIMENKRDELIVFITSDHRSTGILLDCVPQEERKVIHLIVLDAHSDCQGKLDCLENYNVMSWVGLKCPVAKKTIIGIRDIDSQSPNTLDNFDSIFTSLDVCSIGVAGVLSEILNDIDASHEVWLSIDLDVLDPLIFKAVNAPVSGGLLPRELIAIVSTLAHLVTVVEITEFASLSASKEEFLFVSDVVSALCTI